AEAIGWKVRYAIWKLKAGSGRASPRLSAALGRDCPQREFVTRLRTELKLLVQLSRSENQASTPFQRVRCISTRCKTCRSARTGATRNYPRFCAICLPSLAGRSDVLAKKYVFLSRLPADQYSQ